MQSQTSLDTTTRTGVETPARTSSRLCADGFHAASHVCMTPSASVCTARTVASTAPFAVLRSEQWKPSPIAIGCVLVLFRMKKSDETVASRHGSPASKCVRISRARDEVAGARRSVRKGEGLCRVMVKVSYARWPFAKKRRSMATFQPVYFAFVAPTFGAVALGNASGK